MQTDVSGICIRTANEEDAPEILGWLREAFEEFRSRYTPQAFADTVLTMETLRERLKEMTVFVAVNSAHRIVGTIACQVLSSGEGHLRGWEDGGVAVDTREGPSRSTLGAGGNGVAVARMRAHNVGYDRAARACDALL